MEPCQSLQVFGVLRKAVVWLMEPCRSLQLLGVLRKAVKETFASILKGGICYGSRRKRKLVQSRLMTYAHTIEAEFRGVLAAMEREKG